MHIALVMPKPKGFFKLFETSTTSGAFLHFTEYACEVFIVIKSFLMD